MRLVSKKEKRNLKNFIKKDESNSRAIERAARYALSTLYRLRFNDLLREVKEILEEEEFKDIRSGKDLVIRSDFLLSTLVRTFDMVTIDNELFIQDRGMALFWRRKLAERMLEELSDRKARKTSELLIIARRHFDGVSEDDIILALNESGNAFNTGGYNPIWQRPEKIKIAACCCE